MVKEKELRLALVCFGGVSLAIYMFGITREIQKLLRASKLLHSIRDPHIRLDADYKSVNKDYARETDTETVYFDMLKTIGKAIELRVLADTIAGASAGGINGIFLARAIAEDLPLDQLRTLWLENADVEKLLDDDAISNRWSKFYLRPILAIINRFRSDGLDEELGPDVAVEVRGKLSRFVRSRWFKPPFSGKVFASMLYDGMLSINPAPGSHSSLLPPGYPLDLFVTVTDFYGHAQELKMHSPVSVQEREHRLVIGFHDPGVDQNNKRSLGDITDLAFAARCTASFPGAFPPATLGEMDAMLRSKNSTWTGRAAFVKRAFSQLMVSGSNPENTAFIDGSVLNNKPFGEALAVLGTRPAHREVDRRVVYIDPKPNRSSILNDGKAPGFFQSLRASLSDIPRNQPIRDDLEWLEKHAQRSEQLKRVLNGMADDVDAEINRTIGSAFVDQNFNAESLANWRRHAHRAAALAAGFTYGPYIELKISRVLNDTARHLNLLVTRQQNARLHPAVQQGIKHWATENGLIDIGKINPTVPAADNVPWVEFLKDYDLGFRIRRLRFTIRRLNQLYSEVDANVSHAQIDFAKQCLYNCLSPLLSRQSLRHLSVDTKKTLATQVVGTPQEQKNCILKVADELSLDNLDTVTDVAIADLLSTNLPLVVRDTILRSYLGFSFYDIAVLPMMQWESTEELEQIKVDRISPDDCLTLRNGSMESYLRGGRFGSFGAFFSRTYRENDYLWGRLNGAERMIDIVVSSVEATSLELNVILKWKNDIFRSILQAERQHLTKITNLIDQLLDDINLSQHQLVS